ncbi:MAG: AzlC family ABC transporter permease [Spirochaetales bacterium]|nr:AzlC family ABC transporter permease [Spirochaetales bacterium]
MAALKAAFPHTLPILAGFIVLGMGYGIYLRSSGLPLWYPTVISILVFGGSLEFLLVSMLLAPFQPISVFFLSLLVQIRHLFYGLTLLKKYRGRGLKSLYLIYSMCDETFSVNCSTEVPEGVDEGCFVFFISLLNQSYWVISVTLGSLLGGALTKYSEGVEFVMTAMFYVIFIRAMEKKENRISGIIGVVATLFSLIVFGKSVFLIPSMILILIFLFLFREKIEKGRESV